MMNSIMIDTGIIYVKENFKQIYQHYAQYFN